MHASILFVLIELLSFKLYVSLIARLNLCIFLNFGLELQDLMRTNSVTATVNNLL